MTGAAAIRLDPTDHQPWFNLGRSLQDAGDPDGALRAYRESARLDPTGTRARVAAGIILYARGDRPGAEAEYREVLRVDQATEYARPTRRPAQNTATNPDRPPQQKPPTRVHRWRASLEETRPAR